jgi:transcriptional regulator with XRE-family HTH domain
MVSYLQRTGNSGVVGMHIAERFEALLAAYPHPDGRAWSGQEIDAATGGVVTRSYVTNLRKGRIENPGYEKLRAIAKALGFPPELWFEERVHWSTLERSETDRDREDIAAKVSRLMKGLGSGATGGTYTDAEVARLSLGDLTEQDVKDIRIGKVSDPSVDQITALADVFGVHPSYFFNGTKSPPLLDQEAIEILRDETVSAIAHKSLRLPGRERQMILNIIRQFEDLHDGSDDGA